MFENMPSYFSYIFESVFKKGLFRIEVGCIHRIFVQRWFFWRERNPFGPRQRSWLRKGKVVDGVTDATAWSDLSWLNNPNGYSELKKVATRGKVERGKP
jgi:hypothetical protein